MSRFWVEPRSQARLEQFFRDLDALGDDGLSLEEVIDRIRSHLNSELDFLLLRARDLLDKEARSVPPGENGLVCVAVALQMLIEGRTGYYGDETFCLWMSHLMGVDSLPGGSNHGQ